MNHKTKQVAVFTGDLVGSTHLTNAQIDNAFSTLKTCADQAADWHLAPLQFTRHRGDGWQVILHEPKYALRTALLFRAALKALGPKFDTYIGVAMGAARTDIETDLNNRNDSVFINSGHALDGLKAMTSFSPKLAFSEPGPIAASMTLADHIASDWTPAQAETIMHMLSPIDTPRYTQLAKILNKSRQTVTKTLMAAGFESLFLALNLLEDTDD